jgi:hypothetical protein
VVGLRGGNLRTGVYTCLIQELMHSWCVLWSCSPQPKTFLLSASHYVSSKGIRNILGHWLSSITPTSIAGTHSGRTLAVVLVIFSLNILSAMPYVSSLAVYHASKGPSTWKAVRQDFAVNCSVFLRNWSLQNFYWVFKTLQLMSDILHLAYNPLYIIFASLYSITNILW